MLPSLLLLLTTGLEGQSAALSEKEARGEHLYHVAGCVGCHSPPGRAHLSGGRDNPTLFGTFYAPNISKHPEGLAGWEEQDFFRAMRQGKSPEGERYWPTFAYMAFTKMSDEDISALWAYLQSQPAVPGTVPENEPRYPDIGLRYWRLRAFDAGPLAPDPQQSEQWNRGRYLVQAVGYCDQCHTPRRGTGVLKERQYMGGGSNPGKEELHPNLTPDPRTGIPEWQPEDIARFLETGLKPDGTPTRTDWVMHEKVEDSYSWWSWEDRLAIGVYLKSLDPVENDPRD